MPPYKEMYYTLFRAMTKAVSILQQAQEAAEEMYISEEPPDIHVLDTFGTNDDKKPDGDTNH